MREYVTAVRALVAGEEVTREGPVFTLHRASLDINPPPATPIYLGALGPRMVRLAGEVADGAALNWCTPEQVAWSRRRVAEAAEAAGRDPGAVKLAEYIRVCVDDDVEAARIALAKAALGYAMGPRRSAGEKPMGYRAHFERMGFAAELAELDRMRDQRLWDGRARCRLPGGDAVARRLLRKGRGRSQGHTPPRGGLGCGHSARRCGPRGRQLRPCNDARRTPRPGLRVGLRLPPFESPCVHRPSRSDSCEVPSGSPEGFSPLAGGSGGAAPSFQGWVGTRDVCLIGTMRVLKNLTGSDTYVTVTALEKTGDSTYDEVAVHYQLGARRELWPNTYRHPRIGYVSR